MLWASCGAIAYSYAEEKDKALYMTIQWTLCETGSTIAALVALGINMNADRQNRGAPNAVYIVFIVIQVFAMVMALTLLVRPAKVVRSDVSFNHRRFQLRHLMLPLPTKQAGHLIPLTHHDRVDILPSSNSLRSRTK